MRLGGRLQAAIDILNDVQMRKRPVSESLKDWGLSHRFAGSGDRAAIGNIVYDALRHYASISWRMDSISAPDIVYGALLLDNSIDMQTLAKNLETDDFAPLPLADEKQHLWKNRNLENAPDHIRADVPEWCTGSLEKLLGTGWIEEGRFLAARPSLDLRINSLKSTLEKVIRELAPAGAAPVSWYERALRIAPVKGMKRHPNVQVESAFQKGWFEVQDLGSQIAARLCQAKPGMQILDYCAGSGGKTMALSADMENRGQIHAYDASKARLSPVFARLRRAGVRNVQVYADSKTLQPLSGRMNIVLVDAPCTGTGTWRRRPDIKWRLTASQLEQRVAEQRSALNKAAEFVKPGGELVYITCSLLLEENNHQIEYFQKQHPDFKITDMRQRWNKLVSSQAPLPHFSEYGLVLSPLRNGTDGFFVAIMKKSDHNF